MARFREIEQKQFFLPLAVFLAAFAIRVILNLKFLSLHGPYSSHLIEVWYYLGVARGVESLSIFDPTTWLLRFLGMLTQGRHLYHLVLLGSIFLSSLTAGLLCLWLGRFDRRAGWWAGMAWVFLPAPLTLCLVNFSHDLTQGPILAGLFYCLVSGQISTGFTRWIHFVLAAILLVLSLFVGPLGFGALVTILLGGVAFGISRWGRGSYPARITGLLVTIGLIVFLGILFHQHWLEWLAPLALRFRGIDLAAQVRIGVGDLLGFPPVGFWNRYGLFLFLAPAGLAVAWKRNQLLPLILFLVSVALALSVNRSSRLLDLAMAVLVGLAWVRSDRLVGWITVGTVVFLVGSNLTFPEFAGACSLQVPFRTQLTQLPWMFKNLSPAQLYPAVITWCQFWLALPWVLGLVYLSPRFRPALFLVPSLLALLWVFSAARTSSDQLEYEVYRDLDKRVPAGTTIFAAWNQGYMIRALTDLVPLATPENIDYEITRSYWEDEETAWKNLRARGVDLIHISNRYFGITWADPKTDRYGMRGNTIIGPQPAHIKSYKQMQKTLLFRLNYQPGTLKYFRMVTDRFDPKNEIGVRVFELAREGVGPVP